MSPCFIILSCGGALSAAAWYLGRMRRQHRAYMTRVHLASVLGYLGHAARDLEATEGPDRVTMERSITMAAGHAESLSRLLLGHVVEVT